jgi:hypothetical protein
VSDISGMVAANVPLAGTELTEVVQDGINKKVPVSEVGGSGLDDHVFEAATTLQSCPTGWNIINFQSPSTDPLGMWAAGSPARITIPTGGDGWYLIIGQINLEVGNGDALAAISVNSVTAGDTDAYSWNRIATNAPRDIRTEHLKHLVGGNWVGLQFYQNTGGTRTLGNRSNIKLIRLFAD